MGPTKASFPEMAHQAGLGALTSLTGTSTGVPAVPGVGAMEEKIHRKRAESMGKEMRAHVHEARR